MNHLTVIQLFGSLASFTTNYLLFLILRWPVGFFNKVTTRFVSKNISHQFLLFLFSRHFLSSFFSWSSNLRNTKLELKSVRFCSPRFQSSVFWLARCISSFSTGDIFNCSVNFPFVLCLINGPIHFLLVHLGSLISTLSLCYPWYVRWFTFSISTNVIHFRLIPESRRWYVNSHRVSRVNKLFQNSSRNKLTSVQISPSTIYDKPIVGQDSAHIQIGSFSSLLFNGQLRTITACLTILWFVIEKRFSFRSCIFICRFRLFLSFSYHLTSFPILIIHPIMNHVAMNATEFLAYLAGFFIAPR